MRKGKVVEEVPSFYRVIALSMFRETPGVTFDVVAKEFIPRIDGIDRVIHTSEALSPGTIGTIKHPWYMHTDQDDNLMVLAGRRYVDIYTKEFGRTLSFEVSPHEIIKEGEVIYKGAAMLVWPSGVFHRIRSGSEGSASVNFATRSNDFNAHDNFNIYDLNVSTGEYQLIREGYLDQPP